MKLLIALLSISILCGCSTNDIGACQGGYLSTFESFFEEKQIEPKMKTVGSVDLERYTGLWYEIARYPNEFEKDLVGVTALYALSENGTFDIVNRGYIKNFNGERKKSLGTGWPCNETNSKLKVQFFWPFNGNYWIIELAPDYSYAVVGEPTRKYLWILYRKPVMPDYLYNELLERIVEKHGYNPRLIHKTIQINTTLPISDYE